VSFEAATFESEMKGEKWPSWATKWAQFGCSFAARAGWPLDRECVQLARVELWWKSRNNDSSQLALNKHSANKCQNIFSQNAAEKVLKKRTRSL